MNVKFCGQCGASIPDGSDFCISCGWRVGGPVQSAGGQQPAYNQQKPYNPQQGYIPPQPQGQQPFGQQQINQAFGQGPPQGGYQQPHGKVPPQLGYQQPYGQQPGFHSYQQGARPAGRKKGCSGCMVAVVVLFAVVFGVFFLGGKLLSPLFDKLGVEKPEIGLPSLGGGVSAKDMSGPYSNEFETLSATLNGKTDANYAMMIGKKTTMDSTITMTDDKNGTMKFSGSSYGVEINSALPITVKGDQLEVNYVDPASNAKMAYKGKVSKKDGLVSITGTYETSYTDQASNSVIAISGKWIANSSKGVVSKSLDTGNAKKDVTIDQMQGVWNGKLIYSKIENLDQMPDVTEKDKEMARNIIGKSMDLKMTFEGDKLILTMANPNGGSDDMDDLPPINLSDGVFTTALTMNEKDGTGRMNLSGVVYDEGGQMKIKAQMNMDMAFVNNKTLKVIVDMETAKAGP